jgi:ferritin-like metal-binding protein YciE
MAEPATLKDLYLEELRDLWSANDQMQRVIPKLSEKAGEDLKQLLGAAVDGIKEHTEILKELIAANDGQPSKDHCKGMEGLVKEAEKHASNDAIADSDIRDALILSQYQRMCHYGLAGFGTAAAYAKALGLKHDKRRLKTAVSEIYEGDEAASHVAKNASKLARKKDEHADMEPEG